MQNVVNFAERYQQNRHYYQVPYRCTNVSVSKCHCCTKCLLKRVYSTNINVEKFCYIILKGNLILNVKYNGLRYNVPYSF